MKNICKTAIHNLYDRHTVRSLHNSNSNNNNKTSLRLSNTRARHTLHSSSLKNNNIIKRISVYMCVICTAYLLWIGSDETRELRDDDPELDRETERRECAQIFLTYHTTAFRSTVTQSTFCAHYFSTPFLWKLPDRRSTVRPTAPQSAYYASSVNKCGARKQIHLSVWLAAVNMRRCFTVFMDVADKTVSC